MRPCDFLKLKGILTPKSQHNNQPNISILIIILHNYTIYKDQRLKTKIT